MSRSNDYIKAADEALARMFRTWPSPAAKHDGRDLVMEACDDPDFRKQVADLMHGGLTEGGIDEADLGRLFAAHLVSYAQACPLYEDYVSEALADQSEREVA